MATKYIDTSATNNGDGTTSAQAGAPGGAGAWNSFRELDGSPTYGSAPSAGDDVQVRTADGGGNLTETITSSLTLPANAGASFITVIFDDGTTWATGGGGVFTLDNSGTQDLIVLNGWEFKSADTTRRFKRHHTSDSSAAGYITLHSGSVIRDSIFEAAVTTGARPSEVSYVSSSSVAGDSAFSEFHDCQFILHHSQNGFFYTISQGARLRMVGCEYDLANHDGTYRQIFSNSGTANKRVEIYGGKVTNSNSNHILYNISGDNEAGGFMRLYGFDYGSCQVSGDLTTLRSSDYVLLESCKEQFSMIEHTSNGYSESGWNGFGNHPTLNATLPDGSDTPWSLLCWANQNYCTPYSPHVVLKTQKIYNATAATKTVRLEMLIHNSLTSPLDDEWWVDVIYISNADGLPVHQTSKGAGTGLTSSTASWSSTTYGGNSYTKYKIEVTTSAAIEQYSTIGVNLMCSRPAGAADEFYFVDPDFQLD